MQKIKKEFEIERYKLKASSYDGIFLEDFGLDGSEDFKLVFNENNTGYSNYRKDSFGNAESVFFKDIEDVKKYAKDNGFNHWGVISIFSENGFEGVYINSNDDAFKVYPNNWVKYGTNCLLYIAFAKKEEVIKGLKMDMQNYINGHTFYVNVYDNETEDYVEDVFFTGSNYKEVESILSEYGFDSYWFEKVDFR